MNSRQSLLAVITGLFVLFNFSCAGKVNSSASAEIAFDDGYKTTKKGEIIIDDSSFGQISEASVKSIPHQDKAVTLKDESVLTVMYDAFGNKIETREFPKDSRLLMLSVNTSANGKQEIIVRGRNGERKTLPPEMLDRVLTMNAGEIAQTAGIFETIRETNLPVVAAMQQIQPKQSYTPMQPAPIQQNVEEAADEPNPTHSTEQNPVEQKPEKVEEKAQSPQSSVQKDLMEPVVPKRKDINNQ